MKKPWLVPLSATLLLIGVIAGVAIAVGVYHSHTVVLDGPSMEPTIHAGTTLQLTKYESSAQIKRGDIIEYQSSNSIIKQRTTSGKLIHRVVALPGERIIIKNGTVTVYNQQHPTGFNPDSLFKLSVNTAGSVDLTLTTNQYYVLGDNRPEALDSRTIGPISYSDIIGKVHL